MMWTSSRSYWFLSLVTATILLLAPVLLVAASTSSATPVTIPAGLDPGDKYRLAFVTSTARDATSANSADYDAPVTTLTSTVTLNGKSYTLTSVPELSTALLLSLGLVGTAVRRRRRLSTNASPPTAQLYMDPPLHCSD